ncbi:MAG: insulinase family protein, partial [Chloroflexota bacterium]
MTTRERAFDLQLPVQRHTLANGLRVVLSADHSAPIICVAVYYHVGMRLEPRGRTGFAHLFEHLMFQGSESMAKMEIAALVQANGGNLNGSTRYDYTNYFGAMPAHTLDLALWMEADRMRGPVITQAELDNQRDVVKNEIRVNVLNRPYGSFPWIDMQAAAFTNWHNSHNGYGDMADLDAARL